MSWYKFLFYFPCLGFIQVSELKITLFLQFWKVLDYYLFIFSPSDTLVGLILHILALWISCLSLFFLFCKLLDSFFSLFLPLSSLLLIHNIAFVCIFVSHISILLFNQRNELLRRQCSKCHLWNTICYPLGSGLGSFPKAACWIVSHFDFGGFD